MVSHPAQQVDIQSSVEKLHSLEFSEIVPNYRLDARYARIKREKDVDLKVSVHKLIKELPLHIMACVLSRGSCKWEALFGTSSSITPYLVKALRLLSTLSDACTLGYSSMSPNAGYVSLDLHVISTVIDMANLLLLSCIGPEVEVLLKAAENPSCFKEACQQSQLIDLAIRAVLLYLRAFATQKGTMKNKNDAWNPVAEQLLNHPRGTAFIDATFESSRLLVAAVRQVLIAEDMEFDRNRMSELTFAAGAALEHISLLCASPLFYYRMMLHDPYGTAALRLINECLCLHDPPLATPPFGFEDRSSPGQPSHRIMIMKSPPYTTDRGEGAAELLAARGFALLRALGDYKDVIYLDQIMKSDYTREMTTKTMDKVKLYCIQILSRHSVKSFPVASGEGQLAINVLRALELLSDDGNFREKLAAVVTLHLARLLALSDPSQFRSSWCGGKEAIEFFGKLRDFKGKGDINLVDVNSYSEESKRMYHNLEAAVIEYYKPNTFVEGLVPAPDGMSSTALRYGRRLALERAVMLSLLIANLHYHDDQMNAELKDVFVNNLVALILSQIRLQAASTEETHRKILDVAVQNANELFKTVSNFGPPICENEKCRLLDEVDVGLLSDFIDKLKAARAKLNDKE